MVFGGVVFVIVGNAAIILVDILVFRLVPCFRVRTYRGKVFHIKQVMWPI